jgi:peptidoglycan/LPS O-acetylase OafA/YrhL
MTLDRTPETGMKYPKLGYRPALDGLRGVAIALVVLNHTIGFPTSGITGVELFFVLSGFLITTLLVEEHATFGRVSFRNFYRRRALRLLPALFALLAAFLVYSVVKVLIDGGSLNVPLFGVLAGLGYFTNIVLAVDSSAMPDELRHLWSLAIEEQFYIVWPPVLFLLLAGRRGLALGVLGTALVLAVGQQIRLYHDGASQERIVFGTDTRSTSVVIGCMVALTLLTSARGKLETVARRILPVALAGFLFLLLNFPPLAFFSAWIIPFGLSCACLLLVALDSGSALAKMLSVRPLVFLGRISYSLYLWHVAIYWAFGLYTEPERADIPALALSFTCAIASYYFVELPFLRRKKRLHRAAGSDPRPPAVRALSAVRS